MNLNKAREYFSAYYEGQLDKGLAQSFERALRDDAQLQAEYRAFKGTMEELSILSSSSVELPDDLHEKITARLDRHIWENKQTQRTGLAHWWRLLAIGGAAAAVIAVAVFQANQGVAPGPDPRVSPATIVSPRGEPSKLEILPHANGVTLSYVANESKTIVISDADGKELEPVPVGPNVSMKEKLLANAGERALILSVKVGNEAPVWIALPGSKQTEFTAGSGTLRQFVESIADGYQTPVVLNAGDIQANVVWERGDDLLSTASKLAETQKLKAEVRQGSGERSLLWIQKH